MERLIKNVDEKVWREFRAEAAKHGCRAGDFLARLVKEHKRTEAKKAKAWEHVLSGKKHLSAADAASMKAALEAFERVYEFEE